MVVIPECFPAECRLPVSRLTHFSALLRIEERLSAARLLPEGPPLPGFFRLKFTAPLASLAQQRERRGIVGAQKQVVPRVAV
jgi:hypothetical protein